MMSNGHDDEGAAGEGGGSSSSHFWSRPTKVEDPEAQYFESSRDDRRDERGDRGDRHYRDGYERRGRDDGNNSRSSYRGRGRNRSRSRSKSRDRSGSRERKEGGKRNEIKGRRDGGRDRDVGGRRGELSRSRSRSHSPRRKRSRSPIGGRDDDDKKTTTTEVTPTLPADVDPNSEEGMMLMMGFPGGFDTTKGKKVEGADISGAQVSSKREYRQYMNRRGSFPSSIHLSTILIS
jgi:U4/U6.U5 tri-snRNP-associated protein 3